MRLTYATPPIAHFFILLEAKVSCIIEGITNHGTPQSKLNSWPDLLIKLPRKDRRKQEEAICGEKSNKGLLTFGVYSYYSSTSISYYFSYLPSSSQLPGGSSSPVSDTSPPYP